MAFAGAEEERGLCLEQSHVQTLTFFVKLTASSPCHSLRYTVHHGHDISAEVQRLLCESASPHDDDRERCMYLHVSSYPLLLMSLQVLGGIADTVAQTLTCLRMRQRQKTLNPDIDGKDDFFAIEIGELDKKVPWPEDNFMIPASKRGPPPFDFERLTRFMAYGFLWAPVQHKWYNFLEHTFPLSGGNATGKALRRVAMDQLIFAPIGMQYEEQLRRTAEQLMMITGLATFFSFMTVAEGGGKRAVWQKFQEVYVPALKANYIVWPLVQVLNFRIVPIQFQIVR